MVAKEFLTELAGAREDFEWTLAAGSAVHAERRRNPRFTLRATSKEDPKLVFGPIGAVCYRATGKTFASDSWIEAAETINLSLIDAADLVAAASDRIWKGIGVDRKPDEYLTQLRARLVDAVGIHVPSAG